MLEKNTPIIAMTADAMAGVKEKLIASRRIIRLLALGERI